MSIFDCHTHDVVFVVSSTDAEAPIAKFLETQSLIERDGCNVVRVHPEQQTSRSLFSGRLNSRSDEPLSGAAAMELAENVDSLKFQVTRRQVRKWKIGRRHHHIANRRAARIDFDEPCVIPGCRQP